MSDAKRTEWIQYGHYGFTAYRIWKRKTPTGWWQRHEWQRDDGNVEMEDWISSIPTFDGCTVTVEELELN